MQDENVVQWMRTKYINLLADLDERGGRRWADTDARSLVCSGIAAVAKATGISDHTIRTGIRELQIMSQLEADR